MGDIHASIKALEQAESGSADLDRAIGLTVVRLPHMKGPIHVFARIDASKIPGFDSAPFPPYTSRLDTAVGLVRVLLPGWEWRLNLAPTSGDAIVQAPQHRERMENRESSPGGKTFRVEWVEKESAAYAPIAMVKVALEAAQVISSVPAK